MGHRFKQVIAFLKVFLKTLVPELTIAATFPPPFAAAGRNLIQSATTVLTSAQLLALLGTPVSLVPAPGVGFRVVPLLVIIRFFGGGVAYTDAGGAVSISAGSASFPLANNNIFLVTVSPNRRIETIGFGEILDTAANPPTDDNAALTIQKATNNFAAGTGTARVTVYYFNEPTT